MPQNPDVDKPSIEPTDKVIGDSLLSREIFLVCTKHMASYLPGIPPWQLNLPGAVRAYNFDLTGYCHSDQGAMGELSREEYQDFRKTRVQQLSEFVLEDLKNKKGTHVSSS